MRLLIVLLGLASVLAGCSAYSNADFERIQGKWDAVTNQNDGKNVPLEGRGLEFVHGRLLSLKDGVVEGTFGTYRIDDHKTPKWIDLHDEKRNLDILGIYELNGDTLKICLNDRAKSDADRPKEFNSIAGNPSQVLLVLARRK